MDGAVTATIYPPAQRLLGLAVLLVAVLSIVSNIAYPRQTDFIAYWAAAVLALHGHAAAAYDPAALAAIEHLAADSGKMQFGYPPAFLLVALPFGLLPYTLALTGWIVATAAAYLATARRLLPGGAWLALGFPPVAVNAMIGQNGLLTAALLIGTTIALPRRPLLAGLLVGCLVIKPQLGILFPLAFAAGGQWRAFAGAALSTTGLSALALLCFGSAAYTGFLHAMPLLAPSVSDGASGWYKMASIYTSARLAGLASPAAWTVHIAVASGAAAMVAIVWRGRHDIGAKMATVVAASMLVSPYLYVYDTVALIVPFFWLATQHADRRLLALLWLLPIVSIAQNWGANQAIDLMPLVPIGLLALIARQCGKRRQHHVATQPTEA